MKFHVFSISQILFGVEGQRPKNIPNEQRKCKNTILCNYVSLSIWYEFFKFIFSIPSGTSPTGTIINQLVKGSLAFW